MRGSGARVSSRASGRSRRQLRTPPTVSTTTSSWSAWGTANRSPPPRLCIAASKCEPAPDPAEYLLELELSQSVPGRCRKPRGAARQVVSRLCGLFAHAASMVYKGESVQGRCMPREAAQHLLMGLLGLVPIAEMGLACSKGQARVDIARLELQGFQGRCFGARVVAERPSDPTAQSGVIVGVEASRAPQKRRLRLWLDGSSLTRQPLGGPRRDTLDRWRRTPSHGQALVDSA